MTKEEIVRDLKATGRLDHYDRHHPLWKEAFKLYNHVNGQSLSMKCNKCVATVQRWIES